MRRKPIHLERALALNSEKSSFLSRFKHWQQSLKQKADRRGGDIRSIAETETPFKSELLSSAQMQQHARSIASSHQLSKAWARDQLLARLADNENVIIETCNQLTSSIKLGRQVAPAAEWLLDNYYLIEEQIRTAKRHLPKNYSKELPRLMCPQNVMPELETRFVSKTVVPPPTSTYEDCGKKSGKPRVYDIALEIISHGDGRIDPEGLSNFIAAYQEVSALTLGELWAIPIMLRLALIENLRRISTRLAIARDYRNLACTWAEEMVETVEKDPNSLILMVADMARSLPPMESSFVAELVRRLQGQSAALMLPLTWLSQRLGESGDSIESLVQLESQQQAADQVSVSNSIGSLRFLSTMDWRDFVESLSVVEAILRRDPAEVYARMDFSTRDHYRHMIEKVARFGALSEAEVAESAIRLASQADRTQFHDKRQSHVGYFLIGDGKIVLERAAGYILPFFKAINSYCESVAFPLYLTSIGLLSLLCALPFVYWSFLTNVKNVSLFFIACAALIGGSQLAVTMVNWVTTLLTTPRPLPRMDFSLGIPTEASTVVVVPTMLFTRENIDNLCESLEVRFLANRDAHLRFCLLTDFADAQTESLPHEAELLTYITSKINDLNNRYPYQIESKIKISADESHTGIDYFLLLHRARRWNAEEKVWMGYERKRGKLAEFNAFLRGGAQQAFALIVGGTARLDATKYVITLDTDTDLPRDSARQFVATMEHPLNRPFYDPIKKRITEGYGILQPRVAVSLPGTEASLYELMCGGEVGIDPYTRTVSDVYQDVFGEGSFVGKGIYEVDAFELALKDRMPENRILSHDLLEGCYARAGLLSDVQLHERYPSSYTADASRRHRWIRGDWQIASWLLPKVPVSASPLSENADERRNPLSALSRWKLFDNLRRSLVSPALVILFILGWLLNVQAWAWSLAVLSILLIPMLCANFFNFLRKPDDIRYSQHFSSVMSAARQHNLQTVLNLTFLPFEAWFTLDAIFRTQWRVSISHKKMLEWKPSSETNRGSNNDLKSYCKLMWSAPALALCTASYIAFYQPHGGWYALPILLLWYLSPLIAFWISQPIKRRVAALSKVQEVFLTNLTRRTWMFFENFITENDHWLPLDNVQEYPVAVVARRTSPTNIGLSLLANLAAYDFGYITSRHLLERSSKPLHTMTQLERYQGHFYNWYDTQNLQPLQPMYVSSVDSGNLVGNLLTLKAGLVELIHAPLLSVRYFSGLEDSFRLLLGASGSSEKKILQAFEDCLQGACLAPPSSLTLSFEHCQKLHAASAAIEAATSSAHHYDAEVDTWTKAVTKQSQQMFSDMVDFFPWLNLPNARELVERFPQLDKIPSLQQLVELPEVMAAQLAHWLVEEQSKHANSSEPTIASENQDGMSPTYANQLIEALQQGKALAQTQLSLITHLCQQIDDFVQMEYGFLYDAKTHLLTIGFNVTEQRRDNSFYDLLASEARLASFIAIAQGKIPQENWFAMGRQLTVADGDPILLSWSGSMFEYLMPLLIMPTFPNTLLNQTYYSAVQRQIDYGLQRGVPWGISESGYNAFDASLNYQYRAFGVPGLGFKRGLGDDLVIAPYASMMALMVEPEQACVNLQAIAALGFTGKYGNYEAIDYTASRVPRGQNHAVVRSFMTHHQGMGLLALAYLLLNQPMQRRFCSDPQLLAAMSLLHERVPKATANYSNTTELADIRTTPLDPAAQMRVLLGVDTPTPEIQLLSNGRYHVMFTSTGGSSSRWKDLSLTRWREDGTRDHWGSFCYVRDMGAAHFWSTTFQPTLAQPDSYEVIFTEGRVEIRRADNVFTMHTEVIVSPEDDIELRRTKIVNRSKQRRTMEITSYAEVVLAPAAADAMHPAFSNLFVQTEIDTQRNAILCTRRPRSAGEHMPWMFHLITTKGVDTHNISFETDRSQFLGRGNTVANPRVMQDGIHLSNSQGSVLDPIIAIRHRFILEAGQSVSFDIVTGVSESRTVCLELIDKYRDRHLADRVLELSWTHNQVMLRQLNISDADAQLYSRIANSIVFVNSQLRADSSILLRNHRGQSGLWSSAISGDLPIVLVQIKNQENFDLIRQLVQAHSYWRLKGLAVDLVIWNEEHNGYRQEIQESIMRLISSVTGANASDKAGGIFVRISDQLSNEDRILFQSVARIFLCDSRGSLLQQIARRELNETKIPRLQLTKNWPLAHDNKFNRPDVINDEKLHSPNGYGGYSQDGREYVINSNAVKITPAPWVNIIANAQFGCVISESGQSYTWGENAHEFRLTPWENDPVSDPSGEAFYIRDEETGQYWSPTPLPCRGIGNYQTRHGFGYSVFTHTENEIETSLTVFVALEASLKFSVLRITNRSNRVRKISATAYVEWVLGDLRPKSAMHIVTELDTATQALTARNPYNIEFQQRTAFFHVDAPNRSFTADRNEFIGRNRSLRNPAALDRQRLSGKHGAGLDPCAAMHVPFDLQEGETKELVFTLGLAQSRQSDVNALLMRHHGINAANAELAAVKAFWQKTLGAIQIKTPDDSLNMLANGWLLYQTMACRLWARSGFYQSGGAFGFRDQLQDSMAVVHSAPELTRKHLLLCAAHQFVEGDAQHWWHPPVGRGVRTHCSDDFLWLPLAVCRYVNYVGDMGVLDEEVGFIEGRALNKEEDSYYDLPTQSAETETLYMHCKRAIQKGLHFGEHGLALMGSCDWNDGMDKVGAQGRGESVWLSFFLIDVLKQFGELCARRNDVAFQQICTMEASNLQKNIESNAWDGEWYRRAYYDDGTPLGSSENTECQIDSISQSWAVLSGAGDPHRAELAMAALEKRLVQYDEGIIKLLAPPFEQGDHNPGYIRGYVPGVRENGGQYTHAAIWTAMAFAKMGDKQRTYQLTSLINPNTHSDSAEKVAKYKVEPYVIAADVYAMAPHVGRGGWTWYTGSAGWMQRLIIESLLGLDVQDHQLRIKPCIPTSWEQFKLSYVFKSTTYQIFVTQVTGQSERVLLSLDGALQASDVVTMVDDQQPHLVELKLAQ